MTKFSFAFRCEYATYTCVSKLKLAVDVCSVASPTCSKSFDHLTDERQSTLVDRFKSTYEHVLNFM